MAKAEIKKRTGKTEEECESIIEQYKALRTKSQERKKKEAEASKSNVARINKLKDDNKVIEGTTEKTADAVIETTTKDVAEKIEKQIDAIEQKAETEAKKEVEKEMPKVSATEKKKEVEKKVEEKVKAKTKTIVKRVVIDTSALLTSIAESLGKFDKDSQKEFLIKLRSDIDKLLAKYSYGGMTDGATQIMNIQQSNLSSSSVNPTMFSEGGGVEENLDGVAYYITESSAKENFDLLSDYFFDSKNEFERMLGGAIQEFYFNINVKNQWNIVPEIYEQMAQEGVGKNEGAIQIIGFEIHSFIFNSDLPYDTREEDYNEDEDYYGKGGGVEGKKYKVINKRDKNYGEVGVNLYEWKKDNSGVLYTTLQFPNGSVSTYSTREVEPFEHYDNRFSEGGGVYNRSWHFDHDRHNKSEKYEIPMNRRKKAHGGTIEERMRMRRGM